MATASLEIFAANLRYLMRQKKVEDIQMARALQVDRARVKAWLGAVCYPQQGVLVKICEYFQYFDIFKLFTERISYGQKKGN